MALFIRSLNSLSLLKGAFFPILITWVLQIGGVHTVRADETRHPLQPWIPQESHPTPRDLRTISALLEALEIRASPDLAREGRVFSLADTIPEEPWIYWAGCHLWVPGESPRVDENLYRFLSQGGVVWIELCLDIPVFAQEYWRSSFREWRKRKGIVEDLKPVTSEHVLFRTYYLLSEWLDLTGSSGIYALEIRGRDRLFFIPNLLRGLTSLPAPGRQREVEVLLRQALNLMMYTVTLDYKTDSIHLPYILERRRRHR